MSENVIKFDPFLKIKITTNELHPHLKARLHKDAP